MSKYIEIRKGLDINLVGKALEESYCVDTSENYAVVPDHYVGITPKAVVREGDSVDAGSTLMVDKNRPEIKFVSPVNGVVSGVNRGEKRKLLNITVKPDPQRIDKKMLNLGDVDSYDAEGMKTVILDLGLWPCIKQRPYDRVASPSDTPRDIFVTGYNSAPLAPDMDYLVKGEEQYLLTGLRALTRMTRGTVYTGVKDGSAMSKILQEYIEKESIEEVRLAGPHPVGNVGVMINKLKPVNKGEVVWALNAADVIVIGRILKENILDYSRVIAVTGSEFNKCGYTRVQPGCTIDSIIKGRLKEGKRKVRLISGDVLTGAKVEPEDYLGAYDYQVTAIPEGDDVNEFLGWATPGYNKYSMSHTYFTWLKKGCLEYMTDARIRGGKRAMIMSNEYDRVFPMDILPEYLLKAIIAFDIDKMEKLGIYEVAPEDFALCEFVDTSKIEIQKIVRNGLDLLYKEMN
ncbi:MAG: Na(+)-translocating NADH-quinone reductase subunit A [Tannerella sp.]|jgi:Na+-transporting NADH:ubiquinone oxidoreductase subunit A|nr:Na(+)-translocating NADH-quinone reductase subunit A [Tannerella sp.]